MLTPPYYYIHPQPWHLITSITLPSINFKVSFYLFLTAINKHLIKNYTTLLFTKIDKLHAQIKILEGDYLQK